MVYNRKMLPTKINFLQKIEWFVLMFVQIPVWWILHQLIKSLQISWYTAETWDFLPFSKVYLDTRCCRCCGRYASWRCLNLHCSFWLYILMPLSLQMVHLWEEENSSQVDVFNQESSVVREGCFVFAWTKARTCNSVLKAKWSCDLPKIKTGPV